MDELQLVAFLLGMVRAFESVGWPSHFSADDVGSWRLKGRIAESILRKGDYSLEEAEGVIGLAKQELNDSAPL